jgi:SOS response associated peptidase (SRAP)
MNLITLANCPTEPAHVQRISLNPHCEWMNFAHFCIMGRQSRHRQSKNQMALFKLAHYPNGTTAVSGEAISSATLIVTAANDFTRRIHDRMPALLGQQDRDAWLTGKAGVELLQPAPNDLLRMWPVRKEAGSRDDNGAALGFLFCNDGGRLAGYQTNSHNSASRSS